MLDQNHPLPMQRCYYDISEPYVTPCCGVSLTGDVVSSATTCPYCEQPLPYVCDCGEKASCYRYAGKYVGFYCDECCCHGKLGPCVMVNVPPPPGVAS